MELVLRASVIFLILWLLTRALGKRELSEMSPFEMVVLITIGDLVQQGVTQEDYSVTGAAIAVSTIGLWSLLFSWASFRSKRARILLEGNPAIVVRDGKVLDKVLQAQRVPVDELLEAARSSGIGDLSHVRLGLLEPDGKFSFLQYENKVKP